MANTLNLGNGNWGVKKDSLLGYNSENGNFKPLAFNFDRASSATVVNKAGLIETVGSGEPRIDFSNDAKGALLLEPSRSNLITYSEDFSQSAWTKSNSTITSNSVISPDGTLNASTLTDNTANGIHRLRDSVSFSASTDYSLSVFAKKGTLSNIQLALIGTSTSSTSSRVFDLENGVLGESLTNQTLSNSKITDYGNGWFKCEITAQFASTPNTYQITLAPQSSGNSTTANQVTYDGDGNGNVYIYGAQVEQGSYATSYIPTQGSAVTRVADNAYKQSVTQVIGQSEGTMYIEFVPKDISATQILYQIRSSSGTIGQTDIRLTGGNISTLSNDGGSGQFNMGFTPYSTGTTYKVAVRYKLNDSKIYINGVSVGSDTLCSFTGSSLDQVSFGENLTSFIPSVNIRDARLYNNGLTDAELQALTTL